MSWIEGCVGGIWVTPLGICRLRVMRVPRVATRASIIGNTAAAEHRAVGRGSLGELAERPPHNKGRAMVSPTGRWRPSQVHSALWAGAEGAIG